MTIQNRRWADSREETNETPAKVTAFGSICKRVQTVQLLAMNLKNAKQKKKNNLLKKKKKNSQHI